MSIYVHSESGEVNRKKDLWCNPALEAGNSIVYDVLYWK